MEYADHSDIIQEAYVKFPPLQIQWELIELLHLLEENPPKIICEIGLGLGGTLFILSKYFPQSKFISVDLPIWTDDDGKTEDRSQYGTIIKTFAKDVDYVPGDSRTPNIINKVKEILNGKTIDFLFIDGGHEYETAKSDFENYSPLTKGIVAFHDICPPVQSSPVPVSNKIQVHEYWNKIKNNYKYREIIRSPGQQCFQGIGVIWKD